ncbi:MAG: siphovirus ReqiPepy6 Gp37-like family protein [Sarcina sp.]
MISNTKKTVIEGYVEDIIEELINNECINPENADRIIPNLEVQKNSNLTVRTTYAVTKYSGLLESISSICQSSYYGIEMLMDITSKKYVINIYQGEDKSIETVYSPVIFSEEFNNILSDGYVKSLANYRNTAYVYGSIESGTNGNEVSKESTIEYPVGNNFVGLKRYETSIDCSDPQINGKKIKLTNLNFSQIATALAYENLSINQEVKNFTGTLNVESNLQYRRDFNVGDIVTCMNKDWNLNINSLIVSVSEQYSVNGLSVVIGFGYPLPSIIKKINSRYTRRM